jgi:Tripartite tricarboxylate transporter TctB family.
MSKKLILRVRAPCELLSGLVLFVLAAVAIWSLSGLSQGTLRVAGPAMFPRWIAVAIGSYGLFSIAISFLRDGPPLGSYSTKAALFVTSGIIVFSLGIRSFGLVVSTILLVLIAGLAHPHLTGKEKILLGIALGVSTAVVFHMLLGIPIPLLVVPGTAIAY